MYRIETFNAGNYLIETYWNFLRMVSPDDELLKYYSEGKLDIQGIKKLIGEEIDTSELIGEYYARMSLKYQEITGKYKDPLSDLEAIKSLEEFLNKGTYN